MCERVDGFPEAEHFTKPLFQLNDALFGNHKGRKERASCRCRYRTSLSRVSHTLACAAVDKAVIVDVQLGDVSIRGERDTRSEIFSRVLIQVGKKDWPLICNSPVYADISIQCLQNNGVYQPLLLPPGISNVDGKNKSGAGKYLLLSSTPMRYTAIQQAQYMFSCCHVPFDYDCHRPSMGSPVDL